jgi:hypothetical protein
MLLAIDAGNTNVVFALVGEGGEIRARWRIATDPRRTADEYAVWLHQLLALEGYARADVTKVVIGTVVPRALHNLTVLSQKYFLQDPIVAGEGGWPIALDVVEPSSVGADRALNAMAGHARHAATSSSSTSARRRPSTLSIIRAPIRAGSSPPGSISALTHWSPRRPSCPALPLPRPLATASSAERPKARC